MRYMVYLGNGEYCCFDNEEEKTEYEELGLHVINLTSELV